MWNHSLTFAKLRSKAVLVWVLSDQSAAFKLWQKREATAASCPSQTTEEDKEEAAGCC